VLPGETLCSAKEISGSSGLKIPQNCAKKQLLNQNLTELIGWAA